MFPSECASELCSRSSACDDDDEKFRGCRLCRRCLDTADLENLKMAFLEHANRWEISSFRVKMIERLDGGRKNLTIFFMNVISDLNAGTRPAASSPVPSPAAPPPSGRTRPATPRPARRTPRWTSGSRESACKSGTGARTTRSPDCEGETLIESEVSLQHNNQICCC